MGLAARAALAALVLAGCSGSRGPEWIHAEKEMLDLKADQAECERFFGTSERSIEQCLQAKGWKRTQR